MLVVLPPVVPYRGLRGVDAHGGGGFGAPRGSRTHQGLDFAADTGDDTVASIGGTISRIGVAYIDNPDTALDESDLRSIHIMGSGFWRDVWVKLFYARPLDSLCLTDRVCAGGVIAHAQDRYRYVVDKSRGQMTNHVHLEVRVKQPDGSWLAVDPAMYITPSAFGSV